MIKKCRKYKDHPGECNPDAYVECSRMRRGRELCDKPTEAADADSSPSDIADFGNYKLPMRKVENWKAPPLAWLCTRKKLHEGGCATVGLPYGVTSINFCNKPGARFLPPNEVGPDDMYRAAEHNEGAIELQRTMKEADYSDFKLNIPEGT